MPVRVVAVHLGILHRRRRLVARVLLTGRCFLHLKVVALASLVVRGSSSVCCIAQVEQSLLRWRVAALMSFLSSLGIFIRSNQAGFLSISLKVVHLMLIFLNFGKTCVKILSRFNLIDHGLESSLFRISEMPQNPNRHNNCAVSFQIRMNL